MASRLHRLPLPASQPPFDDELGALAPTARRVGARVRPTGAGGRVRPGEAVQGALALSFTMPGGLDAVPRLRATLRVVGDQTGHKEGHLDERRRDVQADVPGRASGRLPDPTAWSAKLVQAVLETLYGPRPARQLVRWLDEHVYRMLVVHAASRQGFVPTVRAVRTCSPADGVVEASVVVQAGPRVRAAAVRLEARAGRWLCTALDLV